MVAVGAALASLANGAWPGAGVRGSAAVAVVTVVAVRSTLEITHLWTSYLRSVSVNNKCSLRLTRHEVYRGSNQGL